MVTMSLSLFSGAREPASDGRCRTAGDAAYDSLFGVQPAGVL
jgi:hypothetical protein